jgi:hypothetical protein
VAIIVAGVATGAATAVGATRYVEAGAGQVGAACAGGAAIIEAIKVAVEAGWAWVVGARDEEAGVVASSS